MQNGEGKHAITKGLCNNYLEGGGGIGKLEGEGEEKTTTRERGVGCQI